MVGNLRVKLLAHTADIKEMDINGRERVKFSQMEPQPFPFYEFFAGGGMARLGLGSDWRCTFSNDICEKKASAYRAYFWRWRDDVGDVAKLTPKDLPGTPTLVWGSFPMPRPVACRKRGWTWRGAERNLQAVLEANA